MCGKIAGPPTVRSMVPAAAMMLSRTTSASSRWIRLGLSRHRLLCLARGTKVSAESLQQSHVPDLRDRSNRAEQPARWQHRQKAEPDEGWSLEPAGLKVRISRADRLIESDYLLP
jgi:hypothetical protein